MYLHTHLCANVCTFVQEYAHIYLCMCEDMHLCIFVNMYESTACKIT